MIEALESYLEANPKDVDKVYEIAQNKKYQDTLKGLDRYTPIDYQSDKYDNARSVKISTGFKSLDAYAMPRRGYVTVILSPLNHGKTLLSDMLIYNHLVNTENTKVMLFKYEGACFDSMSHLTYLTYIDMYDRGMLGDNKKYWRMPYYDYDKAIVQKGNPIAVADDRIQKRLCDRLFVYDKPYPVDTLMTKIRHALKTNNDVQMVVVDYFQIIETSRDSATRQGIMAIIAAELKSIASENNVSLITPGQLKVEGKNIKCKKDAMSVYNAREAKDISNLGDVVYGWWNETVFQMQQNCEDMSDDIQYCELDVLKTRKQKMVSGLKFRIDKNYSRIVEGH
jgi:replicative DNA helicase